MRVDLPEKELEVKDPIIGVSYRVYCLNTLSILTEFGSISIQLIKTSARS
jgi:hypothetical protein